MRSEIAALPLFDVPTATPYAKGSKTSRQGAVQAQPRAGSQAAMVLNELKASGPLTDQELAANLGLPLNVVNARRCWLVKQGFVTNCGTKKNPRSGVLNTQWGAVGDTA